jgi:hypothetical protein
MQGNAMFHLSHSDKFQTIGHRMAVHVASPYFPRKLMLDENNKPLTSLLNFCSFEVPKSQTLSHKFFVFNSPVQIYFFENL